MVASHNIGLPKNGAFDNVGIEKEIIANWEKQIFKNKEIISQIITLRDKVYVHKDPNKDKRYPALAKTL